MHAGQLVAERFEVVELAGSGGMGSVYRARDRLTGAPVALKVLHTPDPAEAARLMREAKVLASSQHPRIVRYVAHGTSDGQPYLAMEWLEGETLESRLVHGRSLTVAQTLTLGRRLADALAFLHERRIVHRDIKPSNIILTRGDIGSAKLLDLGIARVPTSTRPTTRTGTTVGTPGYMPPEQARGLSTLDARADVFSLGCVLYECVTGRVAFFGDNIMAVLAKILMGDSPRASEALADIPPELDDLLFCMMTKSPDARPKDGAEVLAALSSIAVEHAPPSRAVPGPRSLTTGERRLVCVIMARPTGDTIDVSSAPTVAAAASGAGVGDRLLAAVAPFGAKLEYLATGLLVVTLADRVGASVLVSRAAHCALALARELPEHRVALTTGFGELSGRMAMGDAIDRAARLVSGKDADTDVVSWHSRASERVLPEIDLSRSASLPIAPSADIRLDDTTAGLLGATFDIGGDDAGLFLRGTLSREARRTLLGKPSPFVGRERELATLTGLFADSREERVARTALVTAPPGVGKSRLRRETLQAIAAADETAEVWLARGDPLSQGAPFQLLGQAVRAAAGIRDAEPLVVRRKKLAARVARHLPREAAARLTRFLGELAGVPFEAQGDAGARAAQSDLLLMGDRMRSAFVEWMEAECRAHPVVLVLEDLQWGDLPSVHFVDLALRTLDAAPLLVLAFARPEVRESFPDLWSERGLLELRLAALGKRASEKLVRAMLGDGVEDARVGRLVEHASGNAFYLEELVRAEAEGRDDLPETVLAMIHARLERLDPETRRVLRAGSVFGAAFTEEGAAALLGEEADTAEAIDELARAELVGRRGVDVVFRHASVHDAAYATLTTEDRVTGHRLAAAWLERRGDADAALLAEHFERGEEPARAASGYLQAAAQALEGNDWAATVARADRAIACGTSGDALSRAHALACEALLWRGEPTAAGARGRAALEAAGPGGDAWFTAAGLLALASYRESDVAAVRRVAEAVRDAPAGDVTLFRMVGTARVASRALGTGAVELGDALLASIEPHAASEPVVAAWVHSARAMRGAWLADVEAEVDELVRAIARFEEVGDLRNACICRINASVPLSLVDFAESERMLRGALQIAEHLGLQGAALSARQNLGVAVARQFRVEEALEHLRAAATGFRARGDTANEGASLVYLGVIGRRADLQEAERAVRAGVEALGDRDSLLAAGLGGLARVLLDRGDVAGALQAARRAADLAARAGGIPEGDNIVRVALAEALWAAGEREEARRVVEEARDCILSRAATLRREAWKRTFLEGVREHADVLADARAWLEEE